jgi:CRP/FNR family cyclic AMP-dependent transcriptional regulator
MPPPFVGDFSDGDLAWVSENGIQRNVAAGEAIITEGEPLDDLYLILDGSFMVASDSLAQPLRRHVGPGEILGEVSYINNQLPLATVYAEVDSVVLCISRTKLDRKIAEDAGFAARFHKVVSEFTVDRLYGWRGKDGDAPTPANCDSQGNVRVYELIEKMLRGEFPDPPPADPTRDESLPGKR